MIAAWTTKGIASDIAFPYACAMTLHDEHETPLTHDDCLDNGCYDIDCEGVVELMPAWRGWSSFPRCQAHYDAYCERNEAHDEREAAYQASLYCEHGTYIGSWDGPDYLCGQCEAWEPSHDTDVEVEF